ncbi:MAG: UDP-N-acetylmuramoyl-L-alanine--D-glutamate ligase [Patescibacteria group bacterium]
MKINSHSKIAILGFGVEGIATYDYLISKNITDITICDLNEKAEIPVGAKSILGQNYLDSLESFEIIFRSPGIKFFDQKIQQAKNAGVEITSATKFFFENCPCKIIGVSGTKGKGTTSTLIYEILKNAGRDVYLGGNIGDPAIIFLDKLTPDSLVVLELSSFQLQDLEMSPQISVLLNTTQDHLDYHQDREEYLEAKSSLVRFQTKDDLAIFNSDYEYNERYAKLTPAEIKFVSSQTKTNGAYQQAGKIYVGNAEIVSISEIGLLGKHNWENVMPAILVAQRLGVDQQIIHSSITNFKGLPHRLELIREIDQVKFYNDSFSTNPETSIAGVKSFSVPLVLIAGGYDKGLDYTLWAQEISQSQNLKAVCLIGNLADKMNELLKNNSTLKIIKCSTLGEAVEKGYQELSDTGGVILLSPAAASFDMFKNYKDRGYKFIEAVSDLK